MSFSKEIAKIVNGDGSFEEKKAALKKFGLHGEGCGEPHLGAGLHWKAAYPCEPEH